MGHGGFHVGTCVNTYAHHSMRGTKRQCPVLMSSNGYKDVLLEIHAHILPMAPVLWRPEETHMYTPGPHT